MNKLRFISVILLSAFVGVSCSVTDPEDKRIDELITKMTLDEKIGQLNQVSLYSFNADDAEMIRCGAVGSFLNLTDPDAINEYQRVAVEESRLGIPLIVARDVIHGFNTIFPIPLGQAATFDPDVVRKGARVSALEASAHGIRWTFSPMLDLARDPRWGRIAEGSGEDPLLTAMMGKAMVEGYQNDYSDSTSIASCVKHFVGYGAAEGGRDYNSTAITERNLRNFYLPQFKACVDAGAATLMTSFNDNDGVPSTANKFLLQDVLRDEWGFDGFVVSDWASSAEMINHGFAENLSHAAELAFNAGVDMDMMSYAYINELQSLVEAGKVDVRQIDDAVRNVLRIKFRLGLFDHPYVDATKAESASYTPEALETARIAAVESTVLLENDGILPLKTGKVRKVLVTGPMADAPYDQLGTWIFDGDKEHTITPLKAIKELYGDKVEVIFEPGLTYSRQHDKAGISRAVRAAEKADVILAFLGEEAILSGEAHCLTDVVLQGDQRLLLEKLYNTGKPVVLDIMAGRPLVLDHEASHCNAMLFSFHPGTMGGVALAQLIFGDEIPSGKLPSSFPKATGQTPIYYNHNNCGRPFKGDEKLLDAIPLEAGQTSLGNTSYWLDKGFGPLYPFGYGRSYAKFMYSEQTIDSSCYAMDGVIKASVTVSNNSQYDADEVVQLYVRDLVGSVTRPVAELKDFKRVHIDAGQSILVTFELPIEDLAFYGYDMVKKTEPGDFTLWISGSSEPVLPVSHFTVK